VEAQPARKAAIPVPLSARNSRRENFLISYFLTRHYCRHNDSAVTSTHL
jgi:hypothetical protein